jgi:putative phosphoribosyl transferase
MKAGTQISLSDVAEYGTERASFLESKGFVQKVQIPVGDVSLAADWVMPRSPAGVVLFAHGSGSSRLSVRNKAVASVLQHQGVGTLLLDLLTPGEEQVDMVTGEHRFDIGLLARRLSVATHWIELRDEALGLPLGYFGASTGGAAALVSAATSQYRIAAVVSRGGRPDLAGEALDQVTSPTLLIVGGNDLLVLELNRVALARLHCQKSLALIPGASHLFEEFGAMEEVSALAAKWFLKYFHPSSVTSIRQETNGVVR